MSSAATTYIGFVHCRLYVNTDQTNSMMVLELAVANMIK